jgi:ankyrin repeat protein
MKCRLKSGGQNLDPRRFVDFLVFLFHQPGRKALILGLALTLFACGSPTTQPPTPGASRQFLKLRGYNFDEKSFLSAAAANDVIAVNAFFAAGINPNAKDEETGATALITAAGHGDLEIVKTLLKGGANANERDKAGFTAILRAVQNKQDEVADVLLSQPNLDLNAQGLNSVTVLMSYVARDREDIVQNLLARKANVNLQDSDGDTALHTAAQRGHVKMIEMLLSKGANPNAKNKLGGTPLMWAGVYGYEDAVRLLLGKGADPGLKDNDGMTAADWATKNKRSEVAQLLIEAQKKH